MEVRMGWVYRVTGPLDPTERFVRVTTNEKRIKAVDFFTNSTTWDVNLDYNPADDEIVWEELCHAEEFRTLYPEECI